MSLIGGSPSNHTYVKSTPIGMVPLSFTPRFLKSCNKPSPLSIFYLPLGEAKFQLLDGFNTVGRVFFSFCFAFFFFGEGFFSGGDSSSSSSTEDTDDAKLVELKSCQQSLKKGNKNKLEEGETKIRYREQNYMKGNLL